MSAPAGGGEELPSFATASALCASLLGATSASEQGPQTLLMLEKLMLNTLGSPDEAKFRRVRCGNPTIRRCIVDVPCAVDLLLLFGFALESAPAEGAAADAQAEDVLVLAPGRVGDATVADAIGRARDELDEKARMLHEVLGAAGKERRKREDEAARLRAREADSRVTNERRQLLARVQGKRAEEEKAREETRRLLREDAEERAHKATVQVQRASRAVPLPGGGGPAAVNRLDLTPKKGSS